MPGLFSEDDVTYPPLDTLKPVADGVWMVDSGPFHMMGLPMPLRLTIVRLAEGALWLHSPTRFTDGLRGELERLGTVRHLVAPNSAHWSFLQDWQRAFPKALTWGPEELQQRAPVKKRNVRFDQVLPDASPADWAREMEQFAVEGAAGLKEIDFFHRASRTLILTDLVVNIETEKMPLWMRPGIRLIGAAAPDGKAPIYLRAMINRKRAQAKAAAERMLALAPERVIFSHGRWFERHGAAALRRSWRWLVD